MIQMVQMSDSCLNSPVKKLYLKNTDFEILQKAYLILL